MPSTSSTVSVVENRSIRATPNTTSISKGAQNTGIFMSTRLASASLAKGPNARVIQPSTES